MLEADNGRLPFKSVMITGPFMPRRERDEITDRARRIGVRAWHFYRRMEEILAAADLVVSMGGYNTVCEILTQGTPSLIIPREIPRKEQLIRAQMFRDHCMTEYIPWNNFNRESLREKVLCILENPEPYKSSISKFRLTGLDVMSHRLEACREET